MADPIWHTEIQKMLQNDEKMCIQGFLGSLITNLSFDFLNSRLWIQYCIPKFIKCLYMTIIPLEIWISSIMFIIDQIPYIFSTYWSFEEVRLIRSKTKKFLVELQILCALLVADWLRSCNFIYTKKNSQKMEHTKFCAFFI